VARYFLMRAIVGAPPNLPYQKFGAGTCIADSIANAQPNDVVWPNIALRPCAAMAPLDGPAATLMAAAQAADPAGLQGTWITEVGAPMLAPQGADNSEGLPAPMTEEEALKKEQNQNVQRMRREKR
jgi:hypothetical protein